MKYRLPTIAQSQQVFTALILTSILSLTAGISILDSAIASVPSSPQSNLLKERRGDRNHPHESRVNQLPRPILNAVRRDLSKLTGIPGGELRLVSASEETWSDSCLGLGRLDESCAQVLVEGWRVVMSNGSQNWTYRTDSDGNTIRLDFQNSDNSSENLPKSISDRILQLASELLALPISQFQIIKAESQTWNSACLDLQRPEERCRGIQTPGWRVTVKNNGQRLVYHSDREGSVIRFNQAASKLSEGNQSNGGVQIPKEQLPPPLAQGEIFRAITIGGFANLHYQTTLMNDGRVIKVQFNQNNNTTSQEVIRQISRQELREFQRLLAQEKFAKFNQLDFPAPSGAADYFIVTLTSKTATIRYADIGTDKLPESLESVIQVWTKISSQ